MTCLHTIVDNNGRQLIKLKKVSYVGPVQPAWDTKGWYFVVFVDGCKLLFEYSTNEGASESHESLVGRMLYYLREQE